MVENESYDDILEEDQRNLYYNCYHEWGDEWFDKYGKELGKAMNLIYDYVANNTKYYLVCKEKYGTIRYEYLFFKNRDKWAGIDQDIEEYQQSRSILRKGIALAVYKYPNVWLEILDDYNPECI